MSKKRLYKPEPEKVESSEMGKLPPQAVELEETVLGAILLEKEAYHEVSHILSPDIFYKEQNGLVCKAIIELYNRGEVADIITVTQELKRIGDLQTVGGAHYVSNLTSRIASSANIEFHCRIIQQEWLKREIIRNSTVTIKEAYETGTDSFDLLDEWEKSLMALQQELQVGKTSDTGSLFDQVLKDNEVLTAKEGTITGVPTGFKALDTILGGWQKTDMIVLAARPGMGKTALMLNFCRAAVKSKRPIAIFSLEMSSIQLVKRLASQETEIPLEMFIRQGMDAATLKTYNKDVEELKKAPFYIDDTPALTIFDLRRKARKLKREKKIDLIIIDYLQLMAGSNEKNGNREQEVSAISRGVKALAKELDIPIIALSQLSRESEKRPGASHVPKLSDLRDSGAIEQDADMVMFIYRAEYYGLTEFGDGQPTAGVADIIIAKNRHGALDTVTLKWIKQCTKFVDWNDHNTPEPLKQLQPNTDFL
jgi:replicative DNA helicase